MFDEEGLVEGIEDVAYTDADPFFNKSYQGEKKERSKTPYMKKYNPLHAERAITLKHDFINYVLCEDCYNCGYNALVRIAKELSRTPHLMGYVPAYRFAESLSYYLFYMMHHAVMNDNMTDYIYFLWMYQLGYVNLWNTESKRRCAYFAEVDYIEQAAKMAKSSQPPPRYTTDLDMLTDHLGSDGLNIYKIATAKSVSEINNALDKLKKSDYKDLVFSLLKDELLNNVLQDLNGYQFASGKLPRHLKAKILLMKLILDTKELHEIQWLLSEVQIKHLPDDVMAWEDL